MKIAFVGDIFLGGDLNAKNAGIDIEEFTDAEIVVTNLEQTISTERKLEGKCTLFSLPENLKILNKIGISTVGIANNHIHDNGGENIVKKPEKLDESGIAIFGGGKDSAEASKPLALKNNLFVFGYCHYGKSYLNKVQVATNATPGVNGLSKKKIYSDLKKIPYQSKAILYFHWGKENVVLPPADNIKLAKELLEHPKVHSIIGTHPHKIQGQIKHSGKHAFFSLGNFLFSNFYYAPRVCMVYPGEGTADGNITKEYHPVFSRAYKKWRLSNRISFVLELDTANNEFKKVFVKQADDDPRIRKLKKIQDLLVRFICKALSVIVRLPHVVYVPLQKMYYFFSTVQRYTYIGAFYLFKDFDKWN